jgi:hypothetical protein
MPKFAVISGVVVSNIIVAATRDDAELVTGNMCVEFDPDVDNVKIGDIFEPEAPADPVK